MQVVHFQDVGESGDVFFELLHVAVGGNRLHHNFDAALEDGQRRDDHDDGKQISAERIRHPKTGPEVDEGRRDDDTYGHQHVAQHVQESCVYVDVTGLGMSDFVIVFVRVIVCMTV